MPDPVRILISGYYGYANPGDEAILSVILAELRAALPVVLFTVVSGTPAETQKTYGVDAVLWSDPLAIATAVRASDLVITGGGGIFHDYGGLQENGLFTEGNWGLGFHVSAGLMGALFGKPLVIYAVGAGPIFSEEGRRMTRGVCEAAVAITVRDEGSRELLEKIGVPAGRVRVTADPAFLLEMPPAQRSEGGVPRIGVAIRHWEHEINPDDWEAQFAAGLDMYLDDHGGEAVFLPFQEFPGEQEDDLAVAERVYGKMRKRESARVLRDRATPAEKAAILASCDLVVGMRLHSLIFSIKAGVPFVALAYDEKVRQLVERTGRGWLQIAMPDLKAHLLASKMGEALDSQPVDPAPLVALARENTTIVMDVLAHPTKPRLPLDQLRAAVMALLMAQKQLRAWLADQKINYEYMVRIQQEELDRLRPRVPELEASLANQRQTGADLEQKISELDQRVSELDQQNSVLELALRESEAERLAERGEWEARVAGLEQWIALLDQQKAAVEEQRVALEGQLAALQARHDRTLADWQGYADEISRRLSVYRSQRAWRGMLALRKAYVMLARQGWTGRLAFIPWLFRVMAGGGSVETEQLEFPARPKPQG